MHEYSSSTTLQYLLTYVLVPFCAYSQHIIQLYSVYRRVTEVHSPPQYQASIVKAYTITKLRKVLNGPPTKQYAHFIVKQDFLNRFLFLGMLLSCGQVRIECWYSVAHSCCLPPLPDQIERQCSTIGRHYSEIGGSVGAVSASGRRRPLTSALCRPPSTSAADVNVSVGAVSA